MGTHRRFDRRRAVPDAQRCGVPAAALGRDPLPSGIWASWANAISSSRSTPPGWTYRGHRGQRPALRSSALASKANRLSPRLRCAKLALGYALAEIPNGITRRTTAFFEPARTTWCASFHAGIRQVLGASTRIGQRNEERRRGDGDRPHVCRGHPEGGAHARHRRAGTSSPTRSASTTCASNCTIPPRCGFSAIAQCDTGRHGRRRDSRADRGSIAGSCMPSSLSSRCTAGSRVRVFPFRERSARCQRLGFSDEAVESSPARTEAVRCRTQIAGIESHFPQIGHHGGGVPADNQPICTRPTMPDRQRPPPFRSARRS